MLKCKIFGHRWENNGFTFWEWKPGDSRDLLDFLTPPKKMQKLICKRCKAELLKFAEPIAVIPRYSYNEAAVKIYRDYLNKLLTNFHWNPRNTKQNNQS